MTTRFKSGSTPPAPARPVASWGENLVTIVLGFWLMIGLFVDGWAHQNLPASLETFFTPWHGLFYSGYAATAAWIAFLIWRNARWGVRGRAAIPLGYELGLAGTVLFGLGGVGDMLWHSVFGIEENVEALLSPTHLLLLIGMQLIVLSPFMAGWKNPRLGDAPRLGMFLPTLFSATASLSFVSFFHMYLWGSVLVLHSRSSVDRWAMMGGPTPSLAQNYNLAAILVTTVILMVPLLLLTRRWRLPFASATILFGLNGLLMLALNVNGTGGFRALALLASPVAAGLAADLLLLRLQRRQAAWTPWMLGFVTPVVLWAVHFLCVAVLFGEGWSVELWAGITFMSGLFGFALSLLVAPPAVPTTTS